MQRKSLSALNQPAAPASSNGAAAAFLPVANGTHFNGNGGATAAAGLIQTRCRQTRKLLRVIAGGANQLQVEWANIWTTNTPPGGDATCEIAGPQSVTARMSIEYPAGNPRVVSGSTAYQAGTAYALLDQVTSGGGDWVCIQAGTGQTPADGSAYWRRVTRYRVYWTDGDSNGTVTFASGDYKQSLPIQLSEVTRVGDCIAVLGAFDSGSSSGYLPYAGANGAANHAPFVDWVVDASGGLPAVGSALPDTGVTTQTNGNTTTAGSLDNSTWMKIPYATAITGNIPHRRCVAIFGDSFIQGTGGDIRDGEPCGVLPRSLDGHSWWRIAQGGNRAGCYAPGNAPWQMSVVRRCTAVVTNLGMNDINANLTYAQVQANMQRLWTVLAAQGAPVYAGYPTPISASSDSWATTANQTRYTGGGTVNTTQNPNDDATYLTSVYGQIAMWLSQSGATYTRPDGTSVQVGTAGHPLSGLVDWRALIADPATSWKWNPGYTSDGAHPIAAAAIVQGAYTAQQMEPALLGRRAATIPVPPYSPIGEPPIQSMPRHQANGLNAAPGAAVTYVTSLGVSPGRWYYGFRHALGTYAAASQARYWTLLIGADPAKMKVLTSGNYTFTTGQASTVVDTAIGGPLWIPAGYQVALAITTPSAASTYYGINAGFALLNRQGLGFVTAGNSTNSGAVLSGTAISLFNQTAASNAFAANAFRLWAELY